MVVKIMFNNNQKDNINITFKIGLLKQYLYTFVEIIQRINLLSIVYLLLKQCIIYENALFNPACKSVYRKS